METHLVEGVAVGKSDARVLEIIEAEDFDGGGHEETFGVCNEAGQVYRAVIVTGLTELVGFVNEIERAGFHDIGSRPGYMGCFAPD